MAEEVLATGVPHRRDLQLHSSFGKSASLDCVMIPFAARGRSCLLLMFNDITERRQIEQQLRQAQKMEAIGQLAGGVAHDFNNLLGVIIGYSELWLERLDSIHPMHKDLTQIKEAGDRAAKLTRQLLAFSRKQVLQPKVLDLNTALAGTEKLLRRLIGEDVELRVKPGEALGRVKADPGQIEQIVMNLAVNARDAMPSGGTLTLETMNVELDQDYAFRHPPLRPGAFVLLSITDTGCGMSAETQARIFEPFFTTKEVGKGTGLGLSIVYGIVKQSGGFIWVYSEPGMGTTFKIYLPTVDGEVESEKQHKEIRRAKAVTETILVVEDDAGVRQLTHRSLQEAGYTV
ncbi:MAG: ATP-binding protein, partial [Candidatus Acidiferrales bacterium]